MVKKNMKTHKIKEIFNELLGGIFDTFEINLVMYSQSTAIIRAIYPTLWSLPN